MKGETCASALCRIQSAESSSPKRGCSTRIRLPPLNCCNCCERAKERGAESVRQLAPLNCQRELSPDQPKFSVSLLETFIANFIAMSLHLPLINLICILQLAN